MSGRDGGGNRISGGKTLLWMLGRLNRYNPRAHRVTIEQAADQVERIAARRSAG